MIPTTLADVVALYAARGHEHYGEAVTQIDHAVQTAQAAQALAAAPALVAAALLHDIGHLLAPPAATDRHAADGARVLDRLFGAAVAEPVALHVAAKRYLCAVEPGYAAGLSAASRASLIRQGGPFGAAAAARFAARPAAAAAIALRRCDESGKRRDGITPGLADFLPLLAGLLRPTATA